MFDLQLPRHTSTLPSAAVAGDVALPPIKPIGETRTDPLPLSLRPHLEKRIATLLDPVRIGNDSIQDGVPRLGSTLLRLASVPSRP